MCDVSVKRNYGFINHSFCGVTLWGEEGGGVKHNVKMTLFSAKIVWTSPLSQRACA